eukprot:1666415-Prymnesium_polylepis.1
MLCSASVWRSPCVPMPTTSAHRRPMRTRAPPPRSPRVPGAAMAPHACAHADCRLQRRIARAVACHRIRVIARPAWPRRSRASGVGEQVVRWLMGVDPGGFKLNENLNVRVRRARRTIPTRARTHSRLAAALPASARTLPSGRPHTPG